MNECCFMAHRQLWSFSAHVVYKIRFTDRNIEICFGKGRKHCGKLRKCWLPAFSLFPQCFQKVSYTLSSKELTLFHTIPTINLNYPLVETLRKHFLIFPHCFLFYHKPGTWSCIFISLHTSKQKSFQLHEICLHVLSTLSSPSSYSLVGLTIFHTIPTFWRPFVNIDLKTLLEKEKHRQHTFSPFFHNIFYNINC